MKHFLIDKDEQLQFETRSREYCYDDRLRSCRHFCLWTFQNNSYVPLPPSLKNSWTCFWGLQVERNIPASGVRDVGHLFPLLGAQLFHIRHVRKKCASFRLAEQRKPIAIGFCNSLLIFFLRFYRLIRFLYWPPARENPRLPLATACNFFNGRIKNRNQRPSTLLVAHQFGFDCLLPNVILMMIWLFIDNWNCLVIIYY